VSEPGAGRAGRAVLLALFALWTIWIWRDGNIRAGLVGSGFLHLALLPFHEAGHVIFRLLGNFMTMLGGTLGQLLMPIVAGYALLRRRDAFGAALCLWLLGFSVVDMAVYMYDAADPQLALLGGGTGAESETGHDWVNLFGDTGLLRHARGIGFFFAFVGYLTMLGGLAWAAMALWFPPETEEDSVYSGPA
jgi:hypothetical protein